LGDVYVWLVFSNDFISIPQIFDFDLDFYCVSFQTIW